MSRRAASTPLTDKTQAQVGLGMGESDTAKGATTPPERSPGIVETTMADAQPDSEQVVAQGGLLGSAINDTPMKDEIEEPEYSPPEPIEPVDDPTQLSHNTTGPLPGNGQVSMPPEVTNVLAQLAQFRS